MEVYDIKNIQNVKRIMLEKSDELQSTIDLQRGPLVKLGLFHTIRGSYLFIVCHHLVIDAFSWIILIEDFYAFKWYITDNLIS